MNCATIFLMISNQCSSAHASDLLPVKVIISSDDLRGGGSVSSQCGMIDCTGIGSVNEGECQAWHDPGSQIVLYQYPNKDSRFSGWSGSRVTCPDSGICTVTVNTPVDVQASYQFVKPARVKSIATIDFDDLLTAYSRSTDNDTIQLRDYIFRGELKLDKSKDVTFNGGFDIYYRDQIAYSAIVGKLAVANGRLSVIRLVVRSPIDPLR
jgi:hypothetical protein